MSQRTLVMTRALTPPPPRLTGQRWAELVRVGRVMDEVANRGAGSVRDASTNRNEGAGTYDPQAARWMMGGPVDGRGLEPPTVGCRVSHPSKPGAIRHA